MVVKMMKNTTIKASSITLLYLSKLQKNNFRHLTLCRLKFPCNYTFLANVFSKTSIYLRTNFNRHGYRDIA